MAVEHFRPKGALGNIGSNKKSYPGYYWLTYEWSNLLLVKPGVNSDKKDYFELDDDRNRADNHHGDINLELPMIIDPASEDPREHIRFHNEQPYGTTDRGIYTVNLLLLHPDLEEDRREHFQLLAGLKSLLEILIEYGLEQKAKETKKMLENYVKPDAKYSSMAIDLLT